MQAARPPRAPAFALTVPGLGPIVRAQAMSLGLAAGAASFDGRADVVPLGAAGSGAPTRLRSAEDLLADLGTLARRGTAAATASGMDRRTMVDGFDRFRLLGGRVDHRTFRVVVRVRDERTYTRTALRAAAVHRLASLLPGWRWADDPRALEVWVLQTGPSVYRIGLRLPALGHRSRPARTVERPGALRPAAAAAMVHLAGPPQGVLLDPCCGIGTIVAEAEIAGWSPVGGDLDESALQGAVANTGAPVALVDGRRLPLADDAVQAVVTNLPFGGQYRVQGVPVAWYRRVLAEAIRVSPIAVVLAPPSAPYRQALGRLPVDLRSRHDVVLLGRPTSIWTLARRRR